MTLPNLINAVARQIVVLYFLRLAIVLNDECLSMHIVQQIQHGKVLLHRISAFVLVRIRNLTFSLCSHSFDFRYITNSYVNSIRKHFPCIILSFHFQGIFANLTLGMRTILVLTSVFFPFLSLFSWFVHAVGREPTAVLCFGKDFTYMQVEERRSLTKHSNKFQG